MSCFISKSPAAKSPNNIDLLSLTLNPSRNVLKPIASTIVTSSYVNTPLIVTLLSKVAVDPTESQPPADTLPTVGLSVGFNTTAPVLP